MPEYIRLLSHYFDLAQTFLEPREKVLALAEVLIAALAAEGY